MGSTYTVLAPGRWWDDAQSAMESWRDEIDEGNGPGESGALVVAQYWDGGRSVKQGRGYAHRFDLDLDGLQFLRGEALYRYELHTDELRYDGDSWNRSCRQAAKTLLARCDAILMGQQA